MRTFTKKITLLLVVMTLGLTNVTFAKQNKHKVSADYNVIPLPKKVEMVKAKPFTLKSSTQISYSPAENSKMKKNAELLSDYLYEATGLRLKVTNSGSKSNKIILKTGLKCNHEAYQIDVTHRNITINGKNLTTVFYGIQTLRKSTPITKNSIQYPAGRIFDYPRFSYRGVHLDVGRHMYTTDSIKRYIDILALHNINKFHWHLTEDQGWRIEIKKYPKLTEVGSWREQTAIKKFFPGGNPENKFIGDGKKYGEFYTQEEAKEIVKYAQDRHITVIPEIDLPGHMLAALASYPQFGNDTPPYKVACWWGVFDQILAPKEETFTFLENVLTEVMDIFPSKYIHIGGDEAPKNEWKHSKQAQEVIKKLGYKDDVIPNKIDGKKHTKEEKLQSYFITRIEKFLNSRGRQIIGWDEILEGKLAPNATVMSWRGMEGGIQAAKMNHDVIMTPGSHVYFDHYQSKNTEEEPFAIGGFLPVEHVYSFKPVPETLTAEQKKHILGGQANVWTEYIKTFKQVEYMLVPRLAALSEVLWSDPEQKDYDFFSERIKNLIKIYDLEEYNYARHIFDVQAHLTPNTETGKLDITFNTIDNAPIYYTLDGTEPTISSNSYNGKLSLDKSSTLKAKSICKNGRESRTFSEKISVNKSSFKPIKLLTKPANSYAYEGKHLLNNGLRGNNTNYKTGHWMGFQEENLKAIIDLKNPTKVSKASVRTCVVTGDWVLDAQSICVFISKDGKEFKKVAGLETNPYDKTKHWKGITTHTLTFKPIKARFVKVVVRPFKKFPTWHRAKGKPYVFVDEIAID